MMRSVLLLVLLLALMRVAFPQSYVFYFVPEKKSWSEAQTFCRQHYTDLATFSDAVDLRELLSVQQGYKGDAWTGLHRRDAKAPWIWSEQSTSTFMPWAPSQPNNYGGNQHCVVVSNGATLNDLDCTDKFPSVCYTERSKQTVRLTVKSSLDVSDPSVKEEILGKIEQILKEKGLKGYVKLSWKIQSDGNVFQMSRKSDFAQQTCV